jgi:sugar phosphate permease
MLTGTAWHRFQRVRITLFIVLGVSFMLVFFHRVAPAVAAKDLMRDFAIPAAALGSLAAMYFYVYAAMQIPAGVLADTLGVRITASVGAFIAGVGSVIFGLAPDFFLASLGRLLVGLGVSVVFVGFMRLNTVWWSEKYYGVASGMVVVLGACGAVLAAGPLAMLLSVVTWRTTFVGIGLFTFVIAALTYISVRNRPEDAGFPSLREMQGAAAHAERTRHWTQDLWDVLRKPAVWWSFLTNMGLTGVHLAFAGLWGVPLLMDVHGLSRADASLYTTTALAAHGVGSLAVGMCSDRLGRRRPVVIASSVLAVVAWSGFLWLPWGPGLSGFALFASVGFCAGGFIAAYSIAKEVVPPNVAGMALALANAGVFFGAAIVQPVFGVLMDLTWDGAIVDGVRRYRWDDYVNGLWLCLGTITLSCLASLRLPETYARNITLNDARR